MDFRRGHRVTNVFRKRSQGHGRISAVTNCDPGRGRMHCAYGSDHPLIYIQRKCRVEVTSVGLAHARPIII